MSRTQESSLSTNSSSRDQGFSDPEKEDISDPMNNSDDPENADLPSQANGSDDPEKGNALSRIPTDITDWNGPDDPLNPLNWPTWKRYYHILPPALIGFTGSFGSSIVSPAVPAIQQQFGVGTTVAILPLTVYVLALGFGPIIAAPLSETYGRYIVYAMSLPIGALFTMGSGFAQNIWTLCILRFFAGLAFSPALSIGAGTVADTHKAEHRASPSALYILSPFFGPALGPVIGGFVTVRKSWRWTQWTIIFFAMFSAIILFFAQETFKKTIILKRNKKLGLPPPPSPFPSAKAKMKFLMTVTLVRPIHMLLTEPIVGFLSLYVAFNFSVLYAFFAAFPYVFKHVYHFSTETSGLVFLSIGTGCLLAVPTVLLCDRYLYQPQVRLSHADGRQGVVPPEHRLYPAMMGSFGLPIGLFWFAWSAKSEVSWASPVVSAVPFAWGNLSIFIAAATYTVDTYRSTTAASAMAANGFLRYALGGVFPLFTLQMYRNLGINWATSLLAFVTVALMPIPWVLFKYGSKIRARSNYDTLKD